jgi:hypothetical protein
MVRLACLQGSFLILFDVGVAFAIDAADSTSADSFVQARDRIASWATGFAAKKRDSIAGFAKPEAPFEGSYHYVDERTIFGKTTHKEECALHLGRRLESEEWVFNFYLESKRREVDSVSMIHKISGWGTMRFHSRDTSSCKVNGPSPASKPSPPWTCMPRHRAYRC